MQSEVTISWATFGLICRRRWAGYSTLALQPGAPRPTDHISDRVLYHTFDIIRGRQKPKMSVCFFVPYARPQFSADLDQIWRVASLYPPDGHGG